MILGIGVLLSVSTLGAQKYGHLNFGELLSSMPAATEANATLESLQRDLVAEGETMAAEFEQGVTKFRADQASGNFTPVQLQAKQKVLQAKQNAIGAYEEDVSQQLDDKREQLLTPIIAQAEEAIADVAKEGGYTMVFDTSVFNAVLFAAESEDLMAKVKAKLGIKE